MSCTQLTTKFGTKENISTSFELETMRCRSCVGPASEGGTVYISLLWRTRLFHRIFRQEVKRTACFAVIRLEYGNLKTLVEIFRSFTREGMIPPGIACLS